MSVHNISEGSPKGSFWCHIIDAKGAALVTIMDIQKGLVLEYLKSYTFIFIQISGRVKAASDLQE